MDQQACISPSWGTITALKLVFSAYDMPQQGEVDRPVVATGDAAIFAPTLNSFTVYGGSGVPAGSTTLNPFSATSLSANGISVGQTVSSTGGGISSGTYVSAVSNSFASGSGNTPLSTTVTISPVTTSATVAGQSFTFNGLFVPVKFGGKRTFTIEPAHDVITSDPASITLLPNTWFFVRTSASMSGAGMQLMDMPVASRLLINWGGISFSEFDSRGTSVNDQTMNSTTLSNNGGGYWGPVALLAQVSVAAGQQAPGAILVLGDSIAAGAGDTPDSLGLEGYIQRSLENNIPFVAAARGSTTAFGLLAHGDGQYGLSIDTGITDVLIESGRNDIEQFSTSASQLETIISNLVSRYIAAGKRAWCFTVPPTTYSNDGWVSLANQAFPYSVTTSSASASSGATQLAVVSTTGLTAGLEVALNGAAVGVIPAGTTIASVNTGASTITLSQALTGSLASGSKLYFGTQSASASAVETQRQLFNTYLRGNSTAVGCSGVIDIDKIVADQGGSAKWRIDLGQASVDGVHPTSALHQAAVNAGILSPSLFMIP